MACGESNIIRGVMGNYISSLSQPMTLLYTLGQTTLNKTTQTYTYPWSCELCGKTFRATTDTDRFCSTKCADAAESMSDPQPCSECGRLFDRVSPHQTACPGQCTSDAIQVATRVEIDGIAKSAGFEKKPANQSTLILSRSTLISNLQAHQKRILPKNPDTGTRYDLVNVVIACMEIIKQSCCSFGNWAKRSGRDVQIRKICLCKGVLTDKMKTVLAALLAYTISCLETATWLDTVTPHGLPLLVTPRGTRTEAQRKAISAGMAAGKARKEAQRRARDNFFGTDTQGEVIGT